MFLQIFFRFSELTTDRARVYRSGRSTWFRRVVLLSYGLWQRRFGGDAGIVGQIITLNGESYTVSELCRRVFSFLPVTIRHGFRLPLLLRKQRNRGRHYLQVFARLKPGVTL